MTTATWESRAPAGHYRFRQVARMEWIKLWSLRSTWWTLAITFAGAVGIAVAVGAKTKDASGDLTNNALAGVIPGMLTIGVLGVLVMTGEYSSGTIRSTLAAVPDRRLLLAAKTAVYGARRWRSGRPRRSSPSWPAGPPCRPRRRRPLHSASRGCCERSC